MATTTDLENRMQRWLESRASGKAISPDEICFDRPELADAVRKQIQKIERMEKLLLVANTDHPTADGKDTDDRRWEGYQDLGKIGEGGMGNVHKVRELATGRVVALKQMKHFDAPALERFKREFRALQDIQHENIVTIYDVISDGTNWFFTMEFVEGRPFPGSTGASHHDTSESVTIDQSSSPPDVPVPEARQEERTCSHRSEHPEQFRGAFLQLAEGILALHENGVLHRDIKPSNVLCTKPGLVKILDVGLVTEATFDEHSRTNQGLAGTLPYMAPEQANGRAEKASDWYSFGVILFNVLTGRHPFRGTRHEMPWARQGCEIHPPRESNAAVPEDLSQLCVELLRVQPSERPTGAEVRHRLAAAEKTLIPAMPAAPLFLGRERHLATLANAFTESQRTSGAVVFLHGQSGMGKSALAQHFLDGLRRTESNVVILRGRCYERESVPYKALDGLVDSLGKFWRRLPREQAEALLPRVVGPLVRVFPVLLRVEAVTRAPRRTNEAIDPHQQRRDAFKALREVLARIGDRWSLVVHLDDLQWGDVDSALMLTELLLPPDPPRLMLVASFRTEDRETSPFLRSFLPANVSAEIDQREISLERLTFGEARDLAAHLLGDANTAEAAESAARESAGNPFFVYPLVQAILAGAPVALDQVIWDRVCSIPEGQRRLLEIVAVAGRPMHASTAIRAAELDDAGRKAIIGLQAARLLRGGSTEEIETYHDRIRETIVVRLAPDVIPERHRRLAIALESSGRDVDPEVLAEHLHRCGEHDRAGEKYQEAAAKAGQTFAFDRAAKLYRLALEVRRCTPEEKRRLQTLLGQALADAGRGAEAARTFLQAVAGAPPEDALKLQRRAGEQFLRSGHLDEGIEAMRLVLAQIGIKLPETRWQIFWALAWGRFRLWWRGTSFRERRADEQELSRVDLCFDVGNTLALADAMRGKALHVRYFYLMALDSGEPGRVALAYSMAAVGVVIRNGSNAAKSERLLEMARALAQKCDRPYVRAMVTAMDGCVGLLMGQWKRGYEKSKEADEIFANECTGVAWERGIGFHYIYTCLLMRGMWKQCAEELPPLVRDALDRGDLFTATSLQIHSAELDLANDDPQKAKQTIAGALSRWPALGFHLQHHHALLGDTNACLYSGEFAEALQIVNDRWRALKESMLLHIQEVRVAMVDCRARCTIAASIGADPQKREELLRAAEQDAKSLAAEGMPYTEAIATLLFASIAYRRGLVQQAVALLQKADHAYEVGDMLHVGASVRWRLGELLEDKGADHIKKAREFLQSQGIRNPVRFLNIHTAAFAAPP